MSHGEVYMYVHTSHTNAYTHTHTHTRTHIFTRTHALTHSRTQWRLAAHTDESHCFEPVRHD